MFSKVTGVVRVPYFFRCLPENSRKAVEGGLFQFEGPCMGCRRVPRKFGLKLFHFVSQIEESKGFKEDFRLIPSL